MQRTLCTKCDKRPREVRQRCKQCNNAAFREYHRRTKNIVSTCPKCGKIRKGHKCNSCWNDWYARNRAKGPRIPTCRSCGKYKPKRRCAVCWPRYMVRASSERRARLLSAEGSWTENDWFKILEHHCHRCVDCGRSDVKLTVGHAIPLCRGGSNYPNNLIPQCQQCNSSQGIKIHIFAEDPIAYGREA